jgi:tryptophan-rich sensory protein
MQPATTATIIIVGVTALLVAFYLSRYRHQSSDLFVPKASWLRAGIYFGACYLVAIVTGVFDALLSERYSACSG